MRKSKTNIVSNHLREHCLEDSDCKDFEAEVWEKKNKSPFPNVTLPVDNLMKEIKHSVNLKKDSKTDMFQNFL